MKLPAIQWYPGDWLKDPGVSALSYEDRGIWFHILMHMFNSEPRGKLTLNGQAMPVEALSRLLGLDNQKTTTTLTTLLTYGVASVEPDTGIMYCRRMVKDEKTRQIRIESGSLGGNPVLLKQKSTTKVKQKSTPSSSSSSSSSDDVLPTSGNTKQSKPFRPPTPDEVRAYGKEIGFDIDAERFCDFYAAKGWLVGKSPMKDWKAAVRNWRGSQHSTPTPQVFRQAVEDSWNTPD